MSARRVVVTGASSGIGAATVRLFRANGWDVVGVARRAERLEELAAETGASVFAADLTVQDDVDALRAHLEATGPIHALVNNAGGAHGLDSVEKSSIDDWVWMYEINVIGTKRVISALLPLLRRGAAESGHADILTVTSIAGHTAYVGGGGYNAAKFAEHALTEVLAAGAERGAHPGHRGRTRDGGDRGVLAGPVRRRQGAPRRGLRRRPRAAHGRRRRARRSWTRSSAPAMWTSI